MVVPVCNNSYVYEPVSAIETDSGIFSPIDQRQKNVEDIEIAVKNIERFVISDNNFLELGDKLKIRQGMHDTMSQYYSFSCSRINVFKLK